MDFMIWKPKKPASAGQPNVGGWLTHGGLALGAGVDFLAVAEHRLIPGRVRSEWSRLRKRGFLLFGHQHPRIPLMLALLV